MNKLNISQIMDLASQLEKTEWITTLISLNNRGQMEQFLKMINMSNLLQETTQNSR